MLSYAWSCLTTQAVLHCNAVNCSNIPPEACQLFIYKCMLSPCPTIGRKQWQKAVMSRNPVSHNSENSFFFFFFLRLRTSWHHTSNTTNLEYPPLHLCNMELYTFPLKPCFWFEVLTPEVGWRVLTTHCSYRGHTGSFLTEQTGPALPLLTCFLRLALRCFHMPHSDSKWISPLCVLHDRTGTVSCSDRRGFCD